MNGKLIFAIAALVLLAGAYLPRAEQQQEQDTAPTGVGSRTTWAVTNTAEFEAACAGAADNDIINMASANYTLTANLILSKILTIHGDNPAGVIIYTAGGIGFSTTKTLVIDNVTILGNGRSGLSIFAGGPYFRVADCNVRAWVDSGTIYGIASAIVGSIDQSVISLEVSGANGYAIQMNASNWINRTEAYVNGTAGTYQGLASENSCWRWVNDTYIKVRMTTGASLAAWQSWGYNYFNNVTAVTEATAGYYIYNFGGNHYVTARNCRSIVNNTGGGGAAGPIRGFATRNDYTPIALYNCSVEINSGTYNLVLGVQSGGQVYVENSTINITQGATNYNAYGIIGGAGAYAYPATPSSVRMQGVTVQNSTVNMNITGGTVAKYGIASYAALTTTNVTVNMNTTTNIPTVAFSNPFTDAETYAITAINSTANISAMNGTAFSSLREYINLVNCTVQSNSTGNFTPVRYMGTIPFNTSGNFSGVLDICGFPISTMQIRDINTTNITMISARGTLWYGNVTNIIVLGQSSLDWYRNLTANISSPMALSWVNASGYSWANESTGTIRALQATHYNATGIYNDTFAWTAKTAGQDYNLSVLGVASGIDPTNKTITWAGPVQNYTLYSDPRPGPSEYITNGSVFPATGYNTTVFRFSVGAINLSTSALNIILNIDGNPRNLTQNGTLWTNETALATGTHGFNFSTERGGVVTYYPNGTITVLPNLPPVLAGESVVPGAGDTNTVFAFAAQFSDSENHTVNAFLWLDGTEYPMPSAGGNGTLGGFILWSGTHTYHIRIADEWVSVLGPDHSFAVTYAEATTYPVHVELHPARSTPVEIEGHAPYVTDPDGTTVFYLEAGTYNYTIEDRTGTLIVPGSLIVIEETKAQGTEIGSGPCLMGAVVGIIGLIIFYLRMKAKKTGGKK